MSLVWSNDFLWCSILINSVLFSVVYTVPDFVIDAVQDGGGLSATCTVGIRNICVPKRKMLWEKDLIYV